MDNTSFCIRWRSFALGVALGIFSMIFVLFAKTERRDKFYSSLLGTAIGMALNFFLLKFALHHQLN